MGSLSTWGRTPWPPRLPVRFAEGEGEMSILMERLRLQNSFRHRGDAHHGISFVVAIRALPKILVRNLRDVVRTDNCAHDTAQFG